MVVLNIQKMGYCILTKSEDSSYRSLTFDFELWDLADFADKGSKCIPHGLPRSHWLNVTGSLPV